MKVQGASLKAAFSRATLREKSGNKHTHTQRKKSLLNAAAGIFPGGPLSGLTTTPHTRESAVRVFHCSCVEMILIATLQY